MNIERLQNGIIIFLRFTILIAIIGGIINLRWTLVFTSTLVLILTFLPNLLKIRYNINFPLEFEFVIVAFIYASLFLGEIQAYYTKYWWWDVMLHTSSGMALGFAGFLILYILNMQQKVKAKPFWMAVFAFSFAVAIGAVWEIFEFGMDQTFGFNMQRSGLIDTMWDLIVDSLGAGLTSVVGYFYMDNRRRTLFSRFLHRFVAKNPQIVHKKSSKL